MRGDAEMEDLIIPGTKFTLDVSFQAENGHFEMAGSSYPENALEFFQPIFQWLEKYLAQAQQPIRVQLKLEYLNTSSSKCVLDFFKILEDHFEAGGDVRIHWYFETDDEDMQEIGEEFLEDLSLPFELIPY